METYQGFLLVVDDNEINRDMLSRRLKRRGYTVMVAVDGKKALKLIEENDFDLVLLDIMMPGIDGIEVLKILRERYSMVDLPVIMVTAKNQSEDIAQALNLGANDYVTKPIDFPVALARIQAQLVQRRAEEENKKQLVKKLEELKGEGISRYDSLIKKKNSYLIKEKGHEKSLSLFSSLIKFGFNGLCLTTKHPEVIKDMYGFKKIMGEFLWMSSSGSGENKVNPSNLTELHGRITEFTKSNENTVLLFLGFEYLITLNGFEKGFRFLNSIIDLITINDSRMILALDPETLNPRELSLLENTLIEIKDRDLIRLGLK
jgi:CheY-like chemotaxis protein